MPSSSWFIVWQWNTNRPVKSRKRERSVTLPSRSTTTVFAPVGHGELLAGDRDQLERIGVDMEDIVVPLILVDDQPLLNRTKRNSLIDAVGAKPHAADDVGEFLVIAGGRILGLIERQRQAPLVGDFRIANGGKRPRLERGRQPHLQRCPQR